MNNNKEDKHKLHLMLIDLYYDYEFDWTPLTIRDLGKLAWVSHPTILNITEDAIYKMRTDEYVEEMLRKEKSYKKFTKH